MGLYAARVLKRALRAVAVKASKSRRSVAASLALLLFICGVSLLAGISYSNHIRPTGIVIHHSAIPLLPGHARIDAKLIDEIHRKRGFSVFYGGRFYHVGYHYVILPDGTVQEGRPEHCRGAHAEGYNSCLGICLVGDFSSKADPALRAGPTRVTPAQFEALVNLCQRLQEKHRIPAEKIYRHHDLKAGTECPGDQFPFNELLDALRD